MKKEIKLAVLDFNSVTVNLYVISRIDQSRISKYIGSKDQEEIVIKFMEEQGHKESECNYMYSENEIPVYCEGQEIFEL